jgi:hypothetical protein
MNPRLAWCVMSMTGSWVLLSACSSSNPPQTQACHSSSHTPIDSNSDAQAPSADVGKILARSCSLGGCHAGLSGAGDLTLPVASGAWEANVVDRPSRENPNMKLVEPGDPTKSWMVLKLTGDYCAFADTCDAQLGCGAVMPFGGALPGGDIASVAAWVRAGALP